MGPAAVRAVHEIVKIQSATTPSVIPARGPEVARSLRGRDAEVARIRDELERLADGTGAVVIVEGAAGMGKSRLVSEAARMGGRLGLTVGSAAAEPGESLVELAALLGALVNGAAPPLDARELTSLRPSPEQRFWQLRELQGLLERAALDSPLLICIDDAQWADAGTVAALRTLPPHLADSPIAWVIAARPSQEPRSLAGALDRLRRNGAGTIALGPLEGGPVAELTADVLGARPDDNVLGLVHEAGGSPFLIVELLLGLLEEGRIRVTEGRAELIDGRLPNRVKDGMRARVRRLSEPARTAVTVAASLGRTFSFGELATTLDSPPSALLAPVTELCRADLLVERDEKLAFWHEITRDAVRASVPASARRALDRQAAGVLLEGGALPVEVAAQLAESAEPGDEVAVTTLLDAARALVASDPATAALFGRRALEIVPPRHPRRGELVGTTAIALHIAGKGEEAIAFADTALRTTLPAEQDAEVRLSIANMFAISAETRVAAGRSALALPDVSSGLRARHLACLIHNLVTAGRIDDARAALPEARGAVVSSGDVRAAFTLSVAESGLEYADERFGPSLDLVTAAHRDGISAEDDQRLRLAHMWHGELLSVVDRGDDALAIATDGLAAARRDRQGWAYQVYETWYGRLLLRVGRLAEASAVLEGRFDLEDGSGAASILEAAGIVALGRLALHTGDERLVRRVGDIARVMVERGTLAVRRHAAWLLALVAMAEDDPGAARRWLRAPSEPGGRPILPRFPLDVADEVQLARIARAANDDELAQLALANARRRAELNPSVPSIAATAAHVRGLIEGGEADLEEAVGLFERSPRRLELASALEDRGTQLAAIATVTPPSRCSAARSPSTWRSGPPGTRAACARRLRALGVRRRIVAQGRSRTARAAITASELAVARLVAQGLTNREVAERLFVSPHTVNSHLRHVFAKLRINSRVELARLAGDHALG